MQVLILGGTGFIGPHLIAALRERGHRITTFDRIRHEPDAPAEIEVLIGDRDGQIEGLRERAWDVVIDNSGFVPRHVRLTAETLEGHVGQYIFMSSICAYRNFATPGIDEDHMLETLQDPTVEEINSETYGGLKVLCEHVIDRIYGSRATILRPTIVVGPGDTTDRFTYWLVRVARGGEALVPGTAEDPIQFIDVRDLADYVCLCAERHICGRYNVCTPPGCVTRGQLVEVSRQLTRSDTKFVWAGQEFLASSNLLECGNLPIPVWPELPMWVPRGGQFEGWPLISSARAVAKGLRFRKLEETVRDTLAWHNLRPADRRQNLGAGLTPERETELLRKLLR